MRATTAGARSAPLPRIAASAWKTSSGEPRGDGGVARRAVRVAHLGVEQAQVVGDLGHRGHGGARSRARGALLQRDGRRHAGHPVDVRPRQRGQELARVGRERLQEAALPLGEDHVERQRALARSARPGHHHDLAVGDRRRDLAQVVLPGVHHLDGGGAPSRGARPVAARARSPLAPAEPARQREPRPASRSSRPSAGVPSATTRPPSAPAPGPRSITQSAAPITSRS